MQAPSSARVRFLRRAANSSVSLLTAVDVGTPPYPELPEQYTDLLDCVWRAEARARQEDRITSSATTAAARHRCAPPAIDSDQTSSDRTHRCGCGQAWVWVWRMGCWVPAQ